MLPELVVLFQTRKNLLESRSAKSVRGYGKKLRSKRRRKAGIALIGQKGKTRRRKKRTGKEGSLTLTLRRTKRPRAENRAVDL